MKVWVVEQTNNTEKICVSKQISKMFTYRIFILSCNYYRYALFAIKLKIFNF